MRFPMCTGMRWRAKRRYLALASCLIAVSPNSFGCEPSMMHIFQMDEMSLNEALLQIGRLTGCVIAFNPDDTRGFQAISVRGHLSVTEAMSRVLTGSNLRSVRTSNGTLTVRNLNRASVLVHE